MVSHVGIIHHGSLLFQGTLSQLQQQRSAGARLTISTSNIHQTAAILKTRDIPSEPTGNQLSLPMQAPEIAAQIVKDLVHAGIDLYELSPVQNDLEAIFMQMITN